ncbi:amidophosphoribosyltransferase [Stratiformator vulcanicus]|uniref:Amidophosphoribosyltransferase n=1 Tax=Stratiformator vulcanicus TaxID=2527980 RepID=A0A517R087_9PLAN|nr:amidophosphoribosyltransferase [Stratiformator vulcanicus]QDT37315.1 Amidophosphoribosyltransferase [Stratiformator vulcanicus]
MADLFHECGIAAVYHLPSDTPSPLAPPQGPDQISRLIPRLLLDMQNRGQLAAGMTTYNESRSQLLKTFKEVGGVTEVFHLNQQQLYQRIMEQNRGPAAIGHVRYATCGKDDRNYAQPFERHHIERAKWFSFGFNGQLANYRELRDEILAQPDFHLSRDTDTEILMHLISRERSGDNRPPISELLRRLRAKLDGAYNIVYLSAAGEMFAARDPLGIRPLCYAIEGPLFAAASESVALANLGFSEKNIRSLAPGHAIIIENGRLSIERFAEASRTAHCFFEWIYFANVASVLDDRSVYLVRSRLGEELAAQERLVPDEDTIVVPVPDTAKAAADAMAYQLNVPCLEGLFRNRYVGRTFIEGGNRADKAKMKYTPVPEVLEGKRVILVEDTIVRSTTMQTLVKQLRERGGAKEVHVRVACPPIVAPCYYGIDMSTVDELFAPKFMNGQMRLTDEMEQEMAVVLEADSLRYLPVEAISRSLSMQAGALCQACVDSEYPTAHGQRLYQLTGVSSDGNGVDTSRVFDRPELAARS